MYEETYMVPASHHHKLLIFLRVFLHQRQLQPIPAHFRDTTHAKQTVELLHTEWLTFLAACCSFKW